MRLACRKSWDWAATRQPGRGCNQAQPRQKIGSLNQLRANLEKCCWQVEQQIEKLNAEIEQGELLKAQATAKETLKLVYDGQLKIEGATRKNP